MDTDEWLAYAQTESQFGHHPEPMFPELKGARTVCIQLTGYLVFKKDHPLYPMLDFTTLPRESALIEQLPPERIGFNAFGTYDKDPPPSQLPSWVHSAETITSSFGLYEGPAIAEESPWPDATEEPALGAPPERAAPSLEPTREEPAAPYWMCEEERTGKDRDYRQRWVR
jgi:hypothetical protein